MKVVIGGSRTLKDFSLVVAAIKKSGFTISEVVSGGARGIDTLGEVWAVKNNVPVKRFLPDWSQGKVAGPMRNEEMVRYAGAVIAIWDGRSTGTIDLIRKTKERRKPLYIHKV